MPVPRSKKYILIALNSFDTDLIDLVASKLTSKGYDIVLYESDKVVHGLVPFYIRTDTEKTQVFYKDSVIDLSSIAAAWYWRPNVFSYDDGKADRLKHESLSKEYRGLQRYLWDSIPEDRWFNSPDAMRDAEGKLWQLDLAREVGFTIPETVVSNRWSDVLSLPAEKLTLKMIYGDLHTKKGQRILYSTTLENNQDALPTHTQSYPGIWQQHLPKKREWRVTVVGKNVFAASIYTSEDARNDWRQHQDYPDKVQFKKEAFPKEQEKMCLDYLARCNLKYGAFDFVETPNGQIIFLELNPNGQYGWIEHELGHPIAAAIADELASIAGTIDK